MSKIKIIQTADLHLGAKFLQLESYGKNREEELFLTFNRIIEKTIEEKAHLLFIAGDLFDSPAPPSSIIKRVLFGLEKLRLQNIKVVIIPGTHDQIIAKNHPYLNQAFANYLIFKEPVLSEPEELFLENTPVYLYGFSFQFGKAEEGLKSLKRRKETGLHLGLLHCGLQASPSWQMREKDLPLKKEDLLHLHLDYLALGHFHQSQIIKEGERIIASYSGSPEGRRFGENGERFIHLVEIDEIEVKLTPLPINTKKLLEKEIDLSLIVSEEELIKEIEALASPETIAKITLSGTLESALDLNKIYNTLQLKFSWLKIIDKSSFFNSLLIKQLEGENTVRGFFVREIKAKIEKANEAEREIYLQALNEFIAEINNSVEAV